MEYSILFVTIITVHVFCPLTRPLIPFDGRMREQKLYIDYDRGNHWTNQTHFGRQEFRLINQINQINRVISSNLILNYPHPSIHDLLHSEWYWPPLPPCGVAPTILSESPFDLLFMKPVWKQSVGLCNILQGVVICGERYLDQVQLSGIPLYPLEYMNWLAVMPKLMTRASLLVPCEGENSFPLRRAGLFPIE